MKKRFFVAKCVYYWWLYDRHHPQINGVQCFVTRAEARKWAKLANHPRAALAWGNTGKLISVDTSANGSTQGTYVHV